MRDSQDRLDPEIQDRLDLLKDVPERDPKAATRGRARFLAEARDLARSEQAHGAMKSGPGASASMVDRLRGWFSLNHREESPPKRLASSLALIGTLAFLLLALFGGSTLTAFAAQGALPGDALYSLKNATESARVSLSRDAAQEAALHMEFAQRRVDEISALISQERYQQLSQATDGFERHIFRGLIALAQVAAQDPGRASGLSDQMMGILADYTTAILELVDRVPDEFRPPLHRAALASQARLLASEIEFTGIVMDIGPDVWTINALPVQVLPTTEIKGDIQVGHLVEVHATIEPDGTLTAREIEPAGDDEPDAEEVELTGIVEAISDGSWVVSGVTIAITPETEIEDFIEVGDSVEVQAILGDDGDLTALEIKLDGDGDEGLDEGDEDDDGNENDGDEDQGNTNEDDDANDNDDDDGDTNDNDDNDGDDNDDNENDDDDDDDNEDNDNKGNADKDDDNEADRGDDDNA